VSQLAEQTANELPLSSNSGNFNEMMEKLTTRREEAEEFLKNQKNRLDESDTIRVLDKQMMTLLAVSYNCYPKSLKARKKQGRADESDNILKEALETAIKIEK